MKQLLNFQPIFDPTNKTVDFKFFPGFSINQLYSIVNVTQGIAIFIPGVTGYGYTSFDGTKITLSYDTSTHKATDVLNVYYEDTNINNLAKESDGNLQLISETMASILNELRIINFILCQGLNVKDSDVIDFSDSL